MNAKSGKVHLRFCACILLAMPACRLRLFNAPSTPRDSSAAPPAHLAPLTCAQGASPLSFSLVAPSVLPMASEITIDGAVASDVQAPGGAVGNLRLDVCFDSGAQLAELRRVVYQDGVQSRLFAIISKDAPELSWERRREGAVFSVPERETRIQGLAAALFGDASGLDVEIPLYDIQRLRLKGMKMGNGWGVVAGSFWTTSRELSRLLAGNLEMGDAFGVQRCPSGDVFREQKLALGTASLSLGICGHSIGVSGWSMDVVEVKVSDGNERLPQAHRGELVFSKPEAVAERLRKKITHHNECDSFRLDVGHAVYAWTRVSPGGCSDVVTDAPLVPTPAPRASWLFRARYGEGEWVEGSVP